MIGFINGIQDYNIFARSIDDEQERIPCPLTPESHLFHLDKSLILLFVFFTVSSKAAVNRHYERAKPPLLI